MNITDTKENLERMDQLIRLKATGTPKELALKFKVTERTVYRIIKQLKEIGCPVYYNKILETYCYRYEGRLMLKFEIKVIDNKDVSKMVNGGGKKLLSFSHTDRLCQWQDLVLD